MSMNFLPVYSSKRLVTISHKRPKASGNVVIKSMVNGQQSMVCWLGLIFRTAIASLSTFFFNLAPISFDRCVLLFLQLLLTTNLFSFSLSLLSSAKASLGSEPSFAWINPPSPRLRRVKWRISESNRWPSRWKHRDALCSKLSNALYKFVYL